jgi:hypothetical protein
LAQIGKYSAIFAVIYANAPYFRELGRSSALAARARKLNRNDRELLKFNNTTFRTLKMFVETYFLY